MALGRGKRMYTQFVLKDGSPNTNDMPWATLCMSALLLTTASMTAMEVTQSLKKDSTSHYSCVFAALKVLEEQGMVFKERRAYTATALGRKTFRPFFVKHWGEQRKRA